MSKNFSPENLSNFMLSLIEENKLKKIDASVLGELIYGENLQGVEDTPLSYAADINSVEMVQYLIANQYTDRNLEDLISRSFEDQNFKITKILLEQADLILSTDFLRDALYKFRQATDKHDFSIQGDILEIIQLILSHENLDINEIRSRDTVFHQLTQMNVTIYEQIAPLFLQREDLDLTAKDSNGNTALHLAVKSNNALEKVESILQREPNIIYSQDKYGYTALHLTHSPEIVGLLLSIDNSIVNIQDLNGNTALHLAVKNNKGFKIIEELLKHGASMTLANREDQTPLDLELEYSSANTLQSLLENIKKNDPYFSKEKINEIYDRIFHAPQGNASTIAILDKFFDREVETFGNLLKLGLSIPDAFTLYIQTPDIFDLHKVPENYVNSFFHNSEIYDFFKEKAFRPEQIVEFHEKNLDIIYQYFLLPNNTYSVANLISKIMNPFKELQEILKAGKANIQKDELFDMVVEKLNSDPKLNKIYNALKQGSSKEHNEAFLKLVSEDDVYHNGDFYHNMDHLEQITGKKFIDYFKVLPPEAMKSTSDTSSDGIRSLDCEDDEKEVETTRGNSKSQNNYVNNGFLDGLEEKENDNNFIIPTSNSSSTSYSNSNSTSYSNSSPTSSSNSYEADANSYTTLTGQSLNDLDYLNPHS